ncbi:hypothetical protein [Nocardioides sp. R-C-SC26]|uniref:hypothetical protein n=1 Tax=Nocardioides sp. R-C-SC26 TaxID=2870414 RepID=UPI001E344665|nr:hypothetical protein [Nocardioides sp. R-C-SC26]
MPTAVSSTDARPAPTRRDTPGRTADAVRAVVDVGHLLRFRMASTRRRATSLIAALALLGLTAAVAVVPAFLPGAGESGQAFDLLLILPTALAGFLILAVVSATASGGGRELIARDPASVFPVSPTTDHLGALLLAPLNIAWLMQAWGLLGMTAFAVGVDDLGTAQPIVVMWLTAGTAVAQVLAWTLEGVRRVPHGIGIVRGLTILFFGIALGLQITDQLLTAFDQVPTREVVVGMVSGFGARWVLTLGAIVAAFLIAVALGAVPATIASRRVPRDELRVEAGRYPARRTPRTLRGMLIRIDRASVWRAVPMRRGVAVLALGPGLVAVLGDLGWSDTMILPGLVASGGALLYGVNAWCLDSRGALWRESLPAPPAAVFDARAFVLGELLLAGSLVTVAIAAVRAGMPTSVEATALAVTLLVVTVQVVAAAMRWSAARPYATDLRSSRATPAPPAVMVGYSARLAISTTMTGLVFSLLSRAEDATIAVLLAVTMCCWSGFRLARTRRRWCDPSERARVVMTVAAS